MKTIIVLTDFSEQALNAANYALQLSQYLRVNLLLYNSSMRPDAERLKAQIIWPTETVEELLADSNEDILLLKEKLQKQLSDLAVESFQPTISAKSEQGILSVRLAKLFAENEVMFMVMANHKTGFDGLFLDNHVQQMIEKAAIPVIIVPREYTFKKMSKIVFATDFSASDVEVIKSVTQFALPFNAEIMLTHISSLGLAAEAMKTGTDFLKEVKHKTDYPKISYRDEINDNVKSGLEWLFETVEIDLLVMVHRDKRLLSRLFNSSHSQRMAKGIRLPLMIYPDA